MQPGIPETGQGLKTVNQAGDHRNFGVKLKS